MTDSSPIVISQESVQRELSELRAMERDLSAKRDRVAKLIDIVRLMGREAWVPSEVNFALESGAIQSKQPASEGTWTSEILRSLESMPEGGTNAEVREIMAQGPIAKRLRTNPNGYYNGVAKLVKDGEIVKYKSHLFTSANFNEFRERLERGDVADIEGRGGQETIADILVSYIGKHSDGVTAREVVRDLVGSGRISSVQAAHNNLSKIALRGRVRREGKRYFPNENGPPEGGPDAGELGHSPN